MKIALTIISFIGLSFVAIADNQDFYQQKIEEGNLAYDQGAYDSAVTLYSQVVNANYQSDQLFYNLGNAYFKSNQLAPAIYYYEKALKINPADPDVAFNLKMANAQIVDKLEIVPEPFFKSLMTSIRTVLSPNQWGYITIIAFILCLALLSGFLLTSIVTVKRLTFYGAAISFICFALCFVFGSISKNAVTSTENGIVFISTLNVKAEPKMSSADLFVIHEGTKVKVLEQGADWLRVALPDGNEGWAQAENVKTF